MRIDRGTEPIAGREHFQGFPRLVFQRFLSTRANRSDPFVRVGRRKLAFYEPALRAHPDPAGTMEGSAKFAGKKGGEQGNPLSGLRKALILLAVLCKTRRKTPDANVRIREPIWKRGSNVRGPGESEGETNERTDGDRLTFPFYQTVCFHRVPCETKWIIVAHFLFPHQRRFPSFISRPLLPPRRSTSLVPNAKKKKSGPVDARARCN